MSLWNDITEKVGAGSKVVADKAKEVSEIANIRAQIVGCDNTLVKNFKELGKAYFEAHKDDLDGEFSEIMGVIKAVLTRQAELVNEGKRLNMQDEKTLTDAENRMNAELALALDMDPEEVPGFIRDKIA